MLSATQFEDACRNVAAGDVSAIEATIENEERVIREAAADNWSIPNQRNFPGKDVESAEGLLDDLGHLVCATLYGAARPSLSQPRPSTGRPQ